MVTRLIPLPEVTRICGLRKSQIYELIQADRFPRPVKLGRASRWSEVEIGAWVDRQLARRDSSRHTPREEDS